MPTSTFGPTGPLGSPMVQKGMSGPSRRSRRPLLGILGILVLLGLISLAFGVFNLPQVSANTLNPTFDHTMPTVDSSCSRAYYSPDGNPFQLCPGPYPTGGNCVWWGWEQFHLLGYNLPDNWGNAAEWAIDAMRSGLAVGTTARVGSIAVFPVADGVWAFGPPGHVAFVTAVSSDGNYFNVTYQNYGDPTRMHIGINYPISVINEPRFQHGALRFVYFPRPINPTLFAHLPGVNGNSFSAVLQANNQLNTGVNNGITPAVIPSPVVTNTSHGSPGSHGSHSSPGSHSSSSDSSSQSRSSPGSHGSPGSPGSPHSHKGSSD